MLNATTNPFDVPPPAGQAELEPVRRVQLGEVIDLSTNSMEVSMTHIIRSASGRLVVALAGLATSVCLVALCPQAAIIRNAIGVGKDNGQLSGFVKAADALFTPAVVAMAGVAPLACLIGAGALMFGHRKGLVMIGAAIGALVFTASIKGLVT